MNIETINRIVNLCRSPHYLKIAFTCFLGLILSSTSFAAGLLTPSGGGLPALDLQEQHVTVTVDGSFVTTTVDQVFFNPNPQQLEAIYSFPVPAHAAVGEFIYWINGKPIIGEVVKKQQAKEIYAKEKNAGRHVAMVEKDEYKTFDIRVSPVLPQQAVKIRLVYLQSVDLDTGIGRYVYPLEEGGVDEAQQAFWDSNNVVSQKFSFNFNLRSAYPVQGIRLPKHAGATIKKISAEQWHVSLGHHDTGVENTSEQAAGPAMRLDQDIVVYWRQQSGLPGGLDLVTYKADANSRGTFMLTLTPGDDLGSAIQNGRDWTFLLDVSGSMQGKYATLVEGVRKALQQLKPQDRFRVIVFNDRAHDLSGGFQPAQVASVSSVLGLVENYSVGNGTNLYAGLLASLKDLDADRVNGIILVTDGVANVGVTEKTKFLALLKKQDVRLFTFIMGNSANRPLLEGMADVSDGFAMSVSNSDDIKGHLMLATSKLGHYAMRDIRLNFDGVRVTDVVPEKPQSLYRGDQLVVFGHYHNDGKLDIVLKAKVGAEDKQYSMQIELPEKNTGSPEIERLWAYYKIQQLNQKQDYLGEDADTEQAITDIALEYGLVTDQTSMIVLEEAMYAAYNIDRTNQKRVQREQLAREQRDMQQVAQQKVIPQGTPMFKQPRADLNRPASRGSSGGGSAGFVLIAILGLLGLRRLFFLKASMVLAIKRQ
ncbi:MAG: hypothetical protein COA42_07385 [Alteromonadaceae bacterium]|nr:MAG: hypothetical protein COA42_07385 [Alteromonadaceae bacterium]